MGKQNWKPGNMLNPVPAVMVSVTDKAGNNNIITVAWAGTVCTNPPMLSISVRPERFSYNMIKETGEFVVNLTTEELLRACDYCGVKSGRDVDKCKELHLTPIEYKLLCLLSRNVGKVLTHTYITQQIWGNCSQNDVASLRVFMATLRKKLEPDKNGLQYIQTHIGIGYRMLRIE